MLKLNQKLKSRMSRKIEQEKFKKAGSSKGLSPKFGSTMK